MPKQREHWLRATPITVKRMTQEPRRKQPIQVKKG